MEHADAERLITVSFWKRRHTNGSNMLLLVDKRLCIITEILRHIQSKEQRITLEKNWYFFVLRRSITGPQVKGSRHNS